MADQAHIPENEWIRDRIERLQLLRRSVGDAQALRVIEELIAEAYDRLAALDIASERGPFA
jgi:hypothetical protein